MDTHDALLAAVLAKPEDDLTRLVYADWCDENGQPERGEFVRVQVEYHRLLTAKDKVGRSLSSRYRKRLAELEHRERKLIGGCKEWGEFDYVKAHFEWRRGFISTVRVSLDGWCGSPCLSCAGMDLTKQDELGMVSICPSCDMARQGTTGIGPEVVRRHPVERVVLTDVVFLNTTDGWMPRRTTARPGEPYITVYEIQEMFADPDNGYPHRDEAGALSTLSVALIAWAKSQPHPARIITTPVSVDFILPAG